MPGRRLLGPGARRRVRLEIPERVLDASEELLEGSLNDAEGQRVLAAPERAATAQPDGPSEQAGDGLEELLEIVRWFEEVKWRSSN